MAKARTRTVTRTVAAPAPVIRIQSPVVRAAQAVRRSRGARVAGAAARRVGGAVAGEKHTITALFSAAVLGFAEKSGWPVPSVAGLSPAATVGLGAWAWGKWGKNATAAHVATGLLSCAVRDWARGGAVQGVMGDDVMGAAVAYEDDMEP